MLATLEVLPFAMFYHVLPSGGTTGGLGPSPANRKRGGAAELTFGGPPSCLKRPARSLPIYTHNVCGTRRQLHGLALV